MIQEKIKNRILETVKAMSLNPREIVLEHPADLQFGDYSCNVAMMVAKEAGMNPRELAEKIKTEIENDLPLEIEKVEVAGPGFINFHLSRTFFTESISDIVAAGEEYGKSNRLAGQRIMIEYTDPNPFKEFHIGHLMSNAVGESLSRLIAFQGAVVIRANYQGDMGLHVAKTMWAILKDKEHFPTGEEMLVDRIRYISNCYVEGSKAYEEHDHAKNEIHVINKKLFEKTDQEINLFYERGRTWTLEHFEEIYRKLGTKFDYYFFESEMSLLGMDIIQDFLQKGVFEESDGAIVFKGEKYGLHTRVFINSQGLPTYEAKELGLNTVKFEKENLDQSIIVTANEQNDYFKVVLEALRHINEPVALKTMHISHGMLRFASGKMSSRKGNIITGESLLTDAEQMIHERIMDREYDGTLKTDIAEKVAVAAIKYSVLKQAIGADIIYDAERSVSFEGDSGPYIQYTCTRARSILGKADGVETDFENIPVEISEVEKLLYRFPETVERAGKDYSAHHVATYLVEIARAFNAYYAGTKIIDPSDPFSTYRIALTKAVSIVLQNGLDLLGIEVPEKM